MKLKIINKRCGIDNISEIVTSLVSRRRLLATNSAKYLLIMLLTTFQLAGSAQTLSLDSCKHYALLNNKRIKEAKLKVDAAEQVKKNAFTKYFPQVDANLVAMKMNKNLIEVDIPETNLPVYDGNPANLPTATQFTYFPGMSLEMLDYANAASITAIQPVYAGGRIRNGNALASLGKEFAEHQLNLSVDQTLMKTEYYYWTILALKEKKKTLNEYEKLVNNLMKDVKAAHNAGLIQKSDLLKVQIELNNLNANKLKLNNGLSLLKMTLAQHIGIDYSENINIADTLIQVQEPSILYNAPGDALMNRNEYQMLNKAVKAEQLQKKMALGEHLPSFAVGVQGMYLDILEQEKSTAIAFATLSIPLSGWWGGSHKVKEHKIKVNVAQNNLEEKSELLKLQMDKTFRDLNESYEQIKVADATVLQVTEHLAVMKDNFDAGIVSASDLLEAQAAYQKSQDTLVDAKTNYKVKQTQYLIAIAQLK